MWLTLRTSSHHHVSPIKIVFSTTVSCRLSMYIVPITTMFRSVVMVSCRLSKQAKQLMKTSSVSPGVADSEDQQLQAYPPHHDCPHHSCTGCMQAVKAGETGDCDIIWLAAEAADLAKTG